MRKRKKNDVRKERKRDYKIVSNLEVEKDIGDYKYIGKNVEITSQIDGLYVWENAEEYIFIEDRIGDYDASRLLKGSNVAGVIRFNGERHFETVEEAFEALKSFVFNKAGLNKKNFYKTSPDWVENEDIWERAKKEVDKEKYPDENSYYAIITTIYKSMGGRIKGKAGKWGRKNTDLKREILNRNKKEVLAKKDGLKKFEDLNKIIGYEVDMNESDVKWAWNFFKEMVEKMNLTSVLYGYVEKLKGGSEDLTGLRALLKRCGMNVDLDEYFYRLILAGEIFIEGKKAYLNYEVGSAGVLFKDNFSKVEDLDWGICDIINYDLCETSFYNKLSDPRVGCDFTPMHELMIFFPDKIKNNTEERWEYLKEEYANFFIKEIEEIKNDNPEVIKEGMNIGDKKSDVNKYGISKNDIIKVMNENPDADEFVIKFDDFLTEFSFRECDPENYFSEEKLFELGYIKYKGETEEEYEWIYDRGDLVVNVYIHKIRLERKKMMDLIEKNMIYTMKFEGFVDSAVFDGEIVDEIDDRGYGGEGNTEGVDEYGVMVLYLDEVEKYGISIEEW